METFKLVWNWSVLALLAAAAVIFAIDLLKLLRRPAEGDSVAAIRKQRIRRALMLLVTLLLLGYRIDRLFME